MLNPLNTTKSNLNLIRSPKQEEWGRLEEQVAQKQRLAQETGEPVFASDQEYAVAARHLTEDQYQLLSIDSVKGLERSFTPVAVDETAHLDGDTYTQVVGISSGGPNLNCDQFPIGSVITREALVHAGQKLFKTGPGDRPGLIVNDQLAKDAIFASAYGMGVNSMREQISNEEQRRTLKEKYRKHQDAIKTTRTDQLPTARESDS